MLKQFDVQELKLGRFHTERLREVYRSAAWPFLDTVEIELIAAGMPEQVTEETGHATVRVTGSGIAHLALSIQRNRQNRSTHEILVIFLLQSEWLLPKRLRFIQVSRRGNNRNRNCFLKNTLRLPIGCRLHRTIKSNYSTNFRPLCFRNALHCRHNSIIEIEDSVNDINVIVFNEDDKWEMPLRTPATYFVAEDTNSTAANAWTSPVFVYIFQFPVTGHS